MVVWGHSSGAESASLLTYPPRFRGEKCSCKVPVNLLSNSISDLFVAVIQLSGSGFNQSFSNRTVDGSRALVVAANCGKHFKHSKALKTCLRSKSIRKIQDAALYIVRIH